jgi:hypothetical protein
MNLLHYFSMVPSRWSRANSPIGLSVRGGPKRVLTSWMKRFHDGCLLLSST